MSIGGALRGMGKQSNATKCVFAGFYFIGHPTSIMLGLYFGLGLPGLLMGFTVGSFSMGILFYMSLTFFTNWDEKAIEIRKKMLDSKDGQDGVNNEELKVLLLH
jgi:Na+-driven multidrug efflux pump